MERAGQFMVKMWGRTARLRDARLQLVGSIVGPRLMRDIINGSVHFYNA